MRNGIAPHAPSSLSRLRIWRRKSIFHMGEGAYVRNLDVNLSFLLPSRRREGSGEGKESHREYRLWHASPIPVAGKRCPHRLGHAGA